jgi:hypothetical protein
MALGAVLPSLAPAERGAVAGVCRWWRLVVSDLSLGAEPTAIRVEWADGDGARLPFFEYEQGVRMSAEEWEAGELEGCACAAGAAGCCAVRSGADACACVAHGLGLGLVECSAACACAVWPSRCANRAVGSGPRAALAVFHRADRGWGVRARERIAAGALVCEYGGERLCAARAAAVHGVHDRARARTAQAQRPFFLMSVCETVGPGERVLRSRIDARRVGSVGRFINHSCAPCLEARTVRVGHVEPRVAFFALCSIGAGEELTYDYAHGDSGGGGGGGPGDGGDSRATARRPADSTTACWCGSACCRGFMPDQRALLDD